jgi:uncharacterized 2Fe-2S/4Fe-4S cluster protein (DUF4445 family)
MGGEWDIVKTEKHHDTGGDIVKSITVVQFTCRDDFGKIFSVDVAFPNE